MHRQLVLHHHGAAADQGRGRQVFKREWPLKTTSIILPTWLSATATVKQYGTLDAALVDTMIRLGVLRFDCCDFGA